VSVHEQGDVNGAATIPPRSGEGGPPRSGGGWGPHGEDSRPSPRRLRHKEAKLPDRERYRPAPDTAIAPPAKRYRPDAPPPTLVVIACGALARELRAIVESNALDGVRIACLPAKLHNRPQLIPEAVRRKIHALRPLRAPIFCAYGDCGTGGLLDAVLAEENVERLPGAHCYAFYAGLDAFDALHDEEPGTFYLTDFLVRHFRRLLVEGLGLDRHPELFDDYFRHYRRVVWLAQAPTDGLRKEADAAAGLLRLPLEVRDTGFGLLGAEVLRRVA